jgi:4-hydroxybenzoate polyprenyltransferase
MRKYIEIMRPGHWSKNIFLFAGLVFGRKLAGPGGEVIGSVLSALAGFLCFSLAASAIYILNDIVDRASDVGHPVKKGRPIASGKVSVKRAGILAVILGFLSVIGSFLLVREFGFVIVGYIVLTVFYSLIFKRMMILDVIVISLGFVLRAIGGAVVVGVFISPWLLICTFSLCLFLGFGKRRSEIELLGDESESFRRTLAGYTPGLLDHMLSVSSGLAVVCFLLYATDDHTYRLFGTRSLVYTTPMVLYCIFRFSALIQQGRASSPVHVIMHDLAFQAGFSLWVLACGVIIYAGGMFEDLWLH